uniref:FLYWCH-type domain-containing protein n=1 Tax=Romanomermis culicivorax TaxID=13658 RepID=A0A915HNN8_ROMCU
MDRSCKCVNYSKMGCMAQVHTNHNHVDIVMELGQHNHAADAAKVKAKSVVNRLTQRAQETEELPYQMIANVTTGNKI